MGIVNPQSRLADVGDTADAGFKLGRDASADGGQEVPKGRRQNKGEKSKQMPMSAVEMMMIALNQGAGTPVPGDDIFLIIGQSNAHGYAGGYSAELDGVEDPRVWAWNYTGSPHAGVRWPGNDELYHNNWATHWDGTNVGFGPKFGRLYAATIPEHREVLLVPAARGGTVTLNWLPDLGQDPPAGGLLLPLAIGLLEEALALQPGNRFVAVLWHQGEGDQATSPSSYEEDIDEIIAYFKTNYPDTLFIMGQQRPGWLESVRGEKSGTVSGRASDSVCDIVGLATGHAIGTSDTCNVYWDGGIRTACTVTASATNQITIATGSGTALPANGTAVIACEIFAANANLIHAKHVATPGKAVNVKTSFWYGPNFTTAVAADSQIHYSAAEMRTNAIAVLEALYVAQANTLSSSPLQVSTPTAVTIGAKSVRIAWTHPRCRVTKFQVQWRTGGGAWTTIDTGSREITHYIRTLAPLTVYEIRVFCTNENGDGTPSGILTVYMDVPGQPTGLTVGSPSTTIIPLTWTAPVGGASIADYVVQHSPAGAGTWTTFSDGTSTTPAATVTGLTPGTSYDFRVAASNVSGTGTYSATVTAATTSNPTHKWDAATAGADLTFDESNRRERGHTLAHGTFRSCKGDLSYASGKIYLEVASSTAQTSMNQFLVGICKTVSWTNGNAHLGNLTDAAGFYGGTNSTLRNGVFTVDTQPTNVISATPANTDVYMIAFDVDAGKAWLGKNGSWFGSGANPATGTNPWVVWTPGFAISAAMSTIYNTTDGNDPGLRMSSTSAYGAPSGFTNVNG